MAERLKNLVHIDLRLCKNIKQPVRDTRLISESEDRYTVCLLVQRDSAELVFLLHSLLSDNRSLRLVLQ